MFVRRKRNYGTEKGVIGTQGMIGPVDERLRKEMLRLCGNLARSAQVEGFE